MANRRIHNSIHLDRFTRIVTLKAIDGRSRPETTAGAEQQPGSAQSAHSAASFQLAGPGARSLAGLADLALQALLFTGLAVAVSRSRPELFPRHTWPWAIPLAFAEFHILFQMLAESFSRGSTPGKRLAGVRVIAGDGGRLRGIAAVMRNICRVVDLLTGYLLSLVLMQKTSAAQALGDCAAGTMVIYRKPLRQQMADSGVPESLYSTSEAGYLLQAWMTRKDRMDDESQSASALDLAAYLHRKYDPHARELPEPATYLRLLYEDELADGKSAAAVATDIHPVQ